ncbi:MAG TPA: MlaD family protein, partial [Gemmatimonadales bacterium]|nr:MlaD family protein [Gemmatimonadales bacterium]
MNLSERTSDALIGLFVAGALVVLLVALYFTQGWNRRSWHVYATSPSAEGLNSDTKVFLQGLEIGRVKSVSPRSGGKGPVTFLVDLELNQRFANDSLIRIPRDIIARIADAGFVGGKAISLETPPPVPGAPAPPAASVRDLAEGDTITGIPKASPLGQIADVADSLARQVSFVLADTRRLLNTIDGTVRDVRGQVATAGPHLQSTLAEVDAGMRHLEPTLRHASALASTADSGFGPLADSITRTMGAARLLLMRLDTLT